MLERTTERVVETPHPRLTGIILVGAALLGVAAVVWLFEPPAVTEAGLTWYRMAIIGYVLVLFGVSGYVAISIFDHRPQP